MKPRCLRDRVSMEMHNPLAAAPAAMARRGRLKVNVLSEEVRAGWQSLQASREDYGERKALADRAEAMRAPNLFDLRAKADQARAVTAARRCKPSQPGCADGPRQEGQNGLRSLRARSNRLWASAASLRTSWIKLRLGAYVSRSRVKARISAARTSGASSAM